MKRKHVETRLFHAKKDKNKVLFNTERIAGDDRAFLVTVPKGGKSKKEFRVLAMRTTSRKAIEQEEEDNLVGT